MAAHKYWALLVTARAGSGNGVGLAEVEMRSTPGGADLCTSGLASGASSFGQVAANAFDDDDATIWHNASTGGQRVRLAYDFAAPVSVAEILVRNPAATGSGTGFPGATYGPAACWVQWSDDGVTWRYGGPTTDLSSLGDAASATIESVSDTAPCARVDGRAVRMVPPNLPPSGPSGARVVGAAARHDVADGGPYRVAGTVKIDGSPPTPVRRRVRLHDVVTGRLVRQAWSDADGAFSFERIRAGEYLVVSDDHTRLYNAVVADRVLAVP